jgi:hypothetical protein
MAKKWTAVQFDLGKEIDHKVKLQRVKLPKDLKVQVDVMLDDPLYKQLNADPRALQKMQEAAKAQALAAIKDLMQAVVVADKKAANFDANKAKIFSKDLQTTLEKRLDLAGKQMAVQCQKFFDDYKKGHAELRKFQVKCVAKIGVSAVVIAGSAAAAGASFGAGAPLAVVAVARGGVTIAQEATKLAIDADGAAKIIGAELTVLKKLMQNEEGELRSRGTRITAEVLLGAASKIIGIETPSVKNFKKHVEVHKMCIQKLDDKITKLSQSIPDLMEKASGFEKKLKAAQQHGLPADKATKLTKKLTDSEKALDKALKKTFKASAAINEAEKRQKSYLEAYKNLKEGLPGWLKYVDAAIGLAVGIGLSTGGGAMDGFEDVIEVAMHNLIDLEEMAIDLLLEKV